MTSRSKPAESVLELNQPIETRAEHRRPDHHISPARGILIGLLASIAIWAGIIAALI